ncbi:MAG: bifunctional DNA-formamidopyrimidine glycosylase/DNA-(apurinic or apyrimidinic site) lyase [Gammaproteobacteria bacterium]|nr:bifunctional DNA-formamidopyrimidine glycosylase/DNA-(apurinic or apyrimidinic site) lyase [Gammaproteobacteria bacterium]
MPELPEVETSKRGISPHISGQKLTNVVVRHPTLRWPVAKDMQRHLFSSKLLKVTRRAKYLLLEFETKTILMHLGMSGSVRITSSGTLINKHDHIDFEFANKKILRFTDPRRFGCCLWFDDPIAQKLLTTLGPEPLSDDFNLEQFTETCKKRKAAIKQVIMDNKVVVGVGNIYAAESLFRASIRPTTPANKISKERLNGLLSSIKQVLANAIEQGGTTLKDFSQSDGKPGYFKQELMVYGREGEPCLNCHTTIKGIRQGQRATAYCPKCQR